MTETVTVTKPCSSIDVLPTVLNLFGIEYDSRLLMGTDILSNTDPIAIINCLGSGGSWHWKTSVGTYNTKTGEFTLNDGVNMSDEEMKNCLRKSADNHRHTALLHKQPQNWYALQNRYWYIHFSQKILPPWKASSVRQAPSIKLPQLLYWKYILSFSFLSSDTLLFFFPNCHTHKPFSTKSLWDAAVFLADAPGNCPLLFHKPFAWRLP